MDTSFFYNNYVPKDEVENWKLNVINGVDKYFWDEAIYSLTKIYDSFEPFMRFCVDMRIQGIMPEEIAKMSKKKVDTIKKTLWRAKKRIKKAIF